MIEEARNNETVEPVQGFHGFVVLEPSDEDCLSMPLTETDVGFDEPREQIKERFLALDLSSQ